MRLHLLLFCPLLLPAHVGVNDVFFEGLAGPYPLFVTVRPPVVIPGVAEISIRSAATDVTSIQLTPMALTGAGAKFPPTPDTAVRSAEDPQFFTSGLWIMASGAWQVRAAVNGRRGQGLVSIPVPAIAQKVSTMDTATGSILFALMLLLMLGLAGIAAAAVRDAQLPAGTLPDAARQKRGRMAFAIGLAVATLIVWQGRGWWNAEAAAYSRSLYKPIHMAASVDAGQLSLQLTPPAERSPRSIDDFIPDHGYLMHLYLLRESSLDAVAHIHPQRQAPGRFATQLPALPAGRYRLFADVVHASGFPETLTTVLEIAQPTPGPAAIPDDVSGSLNPDSPTLPNGLRVLFDAPKDLRAGQASTLSFRVLDKDGNPAANLRPYLGMSAHLAIVKKDFSVFSHLHPNGNISMAAFEMAQSSFQLPQSSVLASSHTIEGAAAVPSEFQFPFGFPVAGAYRLILQFASQTGIHTLAFDCNVLP